MILDDIKQCASLSARRAWIEIAAGDLERNFLSVALRKESVDRNFIACKRNVASNQSLSARRAWIEISKSISRSCMAHMSLSARRAWIEISFVDSFVDTWTVALRKESVDRNK